MRAFLAIHCAGCLIWAISGAASAQAPSDHGFNFVTIGDVGNPAYVGDPLADEGQFLGRGAVGYEYRMARTEIRTSDWLEFVTAADNAAVPLDTPLGASKWGAMLVYDPSTAREIYVLRNEHSGDWPVAGISWWAAALYCNWLHNGKSKDVGAFMSGAYDVSTFGQDTNNNFTDQTTRSPGAKYWIPSVDEWMKAAHWDPNKTGPGEGGWWTYSTGSDTKPVSGLPGVGETNADLAESLGEEAWKIPVGSYPETQSPWGLLDTSGGASEWTESWYSPDDPYDRITDGSSIHTRLPPGFDADRIGQGYIADQPRFIAGFTGLRLASAVPAPGTAVLFMFTVFVTYSCRKRMYRAD